VIVLLLSKSKYLAFLQCSKLLWYHYNARDKVPPPGAATQAIFDQGHEVGLLARQLSPGGIEVGSGIIDPVEVDGLSREALGQREPLYEAGFIHQNAFARADLLVPAGKARWDLLEVKSSTEVKDINLHDLAFQWNTYAGAGLDIRNVFIVHINTAYVKIGAVDPKKLFVQKDVTAQVRPLLEEVKKGIPAALEVVGRRSAPGVPIGPQCNDPYDCPLQDLCWRFLPARSVMSLYRIGGKGFALLEQGVLRIKDLPTDFRLTARQAIQAEAVRTRTPQVNSRALDAFLQQLKYPLYYLDFETFGTAIPIFDDVRPYQQIPFQYSLEIQEKPGRKTRSLSYLSDGKFDPRPEILSRLKRELGDTGSIIAYNASFERNRLAEAVDVFPAYRDWWVKTEPRLIDLLIPFRQFHYYHPDQEGSASIKAVLPGLTGKGYEGMEIADGGMASLEFLRLTMTPVPASEREKVRERLEAYCGRDTGGMVEIVEKLRSLSH
jgi:hypothetical protein